MFSEYKKLKKCVLLFFTESSPYHKANEEARYYIVIKIKPESSERSQNVETTPLRLVFSTFLSCS